MAEITKDFFLQKDIDFLQSHRDNIAFLLASQSMIPEVGKEGSLLSPEKKKVSLETLTADQAKRLEFLRQKQKTADGRSSKQDEEFGELLALKAKGSEAALGQQAKSKGFAPGGGKALEEFFEQAAPRIQEIQRRKVAPGRGQTILGGMRSLLGN